QRRLPGDAGDAGAVVADGADDARHVGAVAVVVQRVVGVGDEVPADEVVGVRGVAVLGVAGVGPTAQAGVVPLRVLDHRLEDVAGVDAAVLVGVPDSALPLV